MVYGRRVDYTETDLKSGTSAASSSSGKGTASPMPVRICNGKSAIDGRGENLPSRGQLQNLPGGGTSGSPLPANGMAPRAGNAMQDNTVATLRHQIARLCSMAEREEFRQYATSHAPAFTEAEIEADSDKLFAKFYKGELSVKDLVRILWFFAQTPRDGQQFRVYASMVRNLVDEHQHFPKYPQYELDLTAELIGQLLHQDLIPETLLSTTLRCIIGAIRSPEDSKMLRFGKLALNQFRNRLEQFPGLLDEIAHGKTLSVPAQSNASVSQSNGDHRTARPSPSTASSSPVSLMAGLAEASRTASNGQAYPHRFAGSPSAPVQQASSSSHSGPRNSWSTDGLWAGPPIHGSVHPGGPPGCWLVPWPQRAAAGWTMSHEMASIAARNFSSALTPGLQHLSHNGASKGDGVQRATAARSTASSTNVSQAKAAAVGKSGKQVLAAVEKAKKNAKAKERQGMERSAKQRHVFVYVDQASLVFRLEEADVLPELHPFVNSQGELLKEDEELAAAAPWDF